MYIAAFFIIAKKWKQTQCSLADELIKCVIPHMKIYLAIKMERSPNTCYDMGEPWKLAKKPVIKRIYYMILFIQNIQNGQIYRDKK